MDKSELAKLTALCTKLGAPDPAGWACSQVTEGIPQLARFVFLREAWRRVLAEDDVAWIDATIAATEADPGAPFAGVGAALARLRAQGAGDADLTEVIHGMQAATLFSFTRLLDDPGELEPEVADVAWALVQISPDGEVLGQISGLHESVLETDPTGREMRPRPDV